MCPGLVLSEAPYAELPEQSLTFVPLHYAGTLFGQAAGGWGAARADPFVRPHEAA